VSKYMQEAFKGIDTTVVPEVQIDTIPKDAQARAFQLLVKMLDLGEIDAKMIGSLENKFRDLNTVKETKNLFLEDLGDESSGVVSFMKGESDKQQPVLSIVLPANTLFEEASASLTPAAIKSIEKMALTIRKKINIAE